jgi:hypothetical protein
MANYGKRLSFFSRSGAPPEAEFSDEQHQALEAVYGVPLSTDARERLKEICDSYVSWRQPELEGETFADAAALFAKVEAAVAGFTPLAFGSLIPMTDAGAQLNNMLERHLSSIPVRVPLSRILDAEEDVPAQSDESGSYQQISLSLDALMRIGIALQAAVNLTGKEIRQTVDASDPVGFMPGQSFEVWGRNLHEWAKRFGLPLSLTQNDDSPAPFIRFFFALNKMMPEPYRENIASPEALAKRVKRARQKLRQIRAQGTKVSEA